MKFIRNILLFFLCIYTYESSPIDPRSAASTPKKVEPCRLQNLGGTQPEQICVLKKFLNEFELLAERRPQDTILLLYGNPGTGKTTVAYELAKESGNEPLFFLATDLSDIGVTVENPHTKEQEIKTGGAAIIALYAKAKKIAEETKQPVVIVIDDVHKIAPRKTHSGINPMMQAAVSRLKSELSPVGEKPNPLIITLITANIYDKDIESSLVSCCKLIEVPIPNGENRLAIINYYANKEKHNVTEELRKKIAEKYAEFTGRNIENTFKSARGLANLEGLEYVEDSHLLKAFKEQQKELNNLKPSIWEKILRILRLSDGTTA